MPCSSSRLGLHEVPLMRAAAGYASRTGVIIRCLDRPCPAPPPSQACMLAQHHASLGCQTARCMLRPLPCTPSLPPHSRTSVLCEHVEDCLRVWKRSCPPFIPFVTANRFSTVPRHRARLLAGNPGPPRYDSLTDLV